MLAPLVFLDSIDSLSSPIQSLVWNTTHRANQGRHVDGNLHQQIKFTQQGIKAISDTTKRAASMKTVAKKMGVKVTNVLWTLGAYDGLLIFEAPDDETATALMLRLGSLGNSETTTVRAFSAAEMDGILAKMTG